MGQAAFHLPKLCWKNSASLTERKRYEVTQRKKERRSPEAQRVKDPALSHCRCLCHFRSVSLIPGPNPGTSTCYGHSQKKKRKKNYDALFKRMKKLQNPRLDILRSLSKTPFFGVFFTCVFSWKIGRSLEKYKTRSGWKMDYVYRFSNELSYAVFKMKEKQSLLLTSVCRLRALPKQSYSPFKMTLADGHTSHPRLLMKK